MAMTRSETGTRARLAWGVAIGSTILAVLFGAFDLSLGNGWSDTLLAATVVLAVGAFGVVGATIAARTGNAVGWALLAVIGAFAIAGSTEAYATYSLLDAAAPLPLTSFFAWVGTIMFFVTIASLVSIPLLYPTGTPRWRWVWRLYLAAVTVLTVGFAILPQELDLMANDVNGPPNPYAVEAWKAPVGIILGIAGSAILLCAALSIASLIVRFRRSEGDERQQIRWLAYVGIAAGVAFVLVFVISAIYGDTPTSDVGTVLENAAFMLLLWIVLFGIPAACGVAVLKYRLYDLDIVVRKAVIFTLVTVTLLAMYLGVLALATLGNAPRLLVGIVLLIVTFRPVHQAARAIADRLVYGKRASAYEVMTEFTGHVGETYATEDVLPRMARILAEGTGAAVARVFLRLGSDQRPVATWPPDAVLDGRRDPGARPRSGRGARRTRRHDASQRSVGCLSRTTGERPRVAGGPRAPQRPTDRGTQSLSSAPRRGAGRRAAQARAQHPRRGAAAARGAERATRAARSHGADRPRRGRAHGGHAPRQSDGGSGGPP